MHKITTTKTCTQRFCILFVLSILALIDRTSAAAGHCYQCNSKNPSCGINATSALKIDGTPCNGQCYTRIHRDDGLTLYRGCSWEHGFMRAQEKNLLILEGNSVWIFCDTSYCNTEATAMLDTVCYQPICDYLHFPEDCKLPHADVTCGRFCNNKLCNVTRHRTRNRHRYRVRNTTKLVS